MYNDPAIKWSGSKRSQASQILSYFPHQIDTYHEPFCGGASVLYALLRSDIPCKRYVASDINEDLIALWKLIMADPDKVANHYGRLWLELNKDSDYSRKKDFFVAVRERFNREHDACDFMFIMRTTTNGMPRYNQDGDFNNSLHVTRCGILPSTLRKILSHWSALLNEHKVEFVPQSYDAICPTSRDFVYLDPPYAGTKGMYYGGIDTDRLFAFLRQLPCPWLLSFDGKSGNKDNTFSVPSSLYKQHIYLPSGNSSFKRTIGKDTHAMVYESLYIGQPTKQNERLLPSQSRDEGLEL